MGEPWDPEGRTPVTEALLGDGHWAAQPPRGCEGPCLLGFGAPGWVPSPTPELHLVFPAQGGEGGDAQGSWAGAWVVGQREAAGAAAGAGGAGAPAAQSHLDCTPEQGQRPGGDLSFCQAREAPAVDDAALILFSICFFLVLLLCPSTGPAVRHPELLVVGGGGPADRPCSPSRPRAGRRWWAEHPLQYCLGGPSGSSEQTRRSCRHSGSGTRGRLGRREGARWRAAS